MNAPIILIPAMAYTVTRKWTEIPVEHQERRTGHSKWSILTRIETYLDLYTLYARRPFAWMLVWGVACIGLSFLFGLGILWYRLSTSEEFSGLIIFFDAFLLTTGVLLFALSMIGEFVVRNLRGNRFEPQQVIDEVVRPGR